ncbi:hypothetical protein JHK86_001477 [Glycine max]|nr:hypothetical protein JHK86_001477 [Glycine max]
MLGNLTLKSSTTSFSSSTPPQPKYRSELRSYFFTSSDFANVTMSDDNSSMHNLRKFNLAVKCFEHATDLVSMLDINSTTDVGKRKLLLDLNLA